jgi:cyclase
MKNFRIIARLEVKSDYVIKGIRMEGLKKIAPPVDIVKSFKNGYVDEIFYDDVVATLYNRPVNFKLIKSISELINIPFSVSGRIRSVSDIYKLFNIGADKVSINTSVFKNPQILNQASKIFGSQSICSHIQYKNLFKYEKNNTKRNTSFALFFYLNLN